MAGEKAAEAERVQTDESLRSERAKTDRAIATRHAAAEKSADEVVLRARDEADAVLTEAREKADQRLAAPEPARTHEAQTAVGDERTIADDVLREERRAADETLRREREESARALAALLPLEREETDRFLLTERNVSDDAVANRDDFLGMVTHDLRSLLAGIVVTAQQIAHADPAHEEATKRIQRYGARMNRLVGDLADVASISAGRLSVTAGGEDAAALVTESVELFQASARARGLQLEAEVSGPLTASFDQGRLLQVLGNLIGNAIKFTAPPGKITVRASATEQTLHFSVEDTGAGIPEHMLAAVFDRFVQVERNKHRGLGLGLYISRSIVEAHGGTLHLESKVGVGSRFYFTIPRGLST